MPKRKRNRIEFKRIFNWHKRFTATDHGGESVEYNFSEIGQ